MSAIAIAIFRCNSEEKLLYHLSGEDGLSVTRYDGAMRIETLLSNDSDDVILYEEWESVEHHQAYVGWRVKPALPISSHQMELS